MVQDCCLKVAGLIPSQCYHLCRTSHGLFMSAWVSSGFAAPVFSCLTSSIIQIDFTRSHHPDQDKAATEKKNEQMSGWIDGRTNLHGSYPNTSKTGYAHSNQQLPQAQPGSFTQCVEVLKLCTSALRILLRYAYPQSFSLCNGAERCVCATTQKQKSAFIVLT